MNVGSGGRRAVIADVLLIWMILGIAAVGVVTTYSRTPVGELPNATIGGMMGGARAAVAYISFTVALAAIAIVPAVLARTRRHLVIACLAVAAIVVGLALWPGSLEETGLEITPARALTTVGALVGLGLTLAAWRTNGVGRLGRERGDAVRIAFAAVLFVGGLPWLAADFGLSLSRLPVLGSIFLTDQLASQPSVPGLHQAVHDGFHHGLAGVLLVWTALLLSRTLGHLSPGLVRRLLTIYTGFLLVYGSAQAFQDFYTEQIVKRGLTTHEIPLFLTPSLSVPWFVIVLLTPIATWLLWLGYRPSPTSGLARIVDPRLDPDQRGAARSQASAVDPGAHHLGRLDQHRHRSPGRKASPSPPPGAIVARRSSA